MYSVIILCAGQGKRTGLNYNKMFYQFDNQTVYEMTLDVFLKDCQCGQIIVVTQNEEKNDFSRFCQDKRIEFVNGGKERQDSVFNGLLKVKYDYVLIHDGARPYVKEKYIKELLKTLSVHKACLLMVPSKDTIKKVIDGKVVETLERASLMQAQTPQAFHRELIIECYKKGKDNHFVATDDAQLVENFSDEEVYVVIGDYENKKITTSEDLR